MTNHPRNVPDDVGTDGGAHGPSPAIPDGGLASVMPDWMRQTPSWKRVPEQPAARSIPEPDTSVIDPRRLIDVHDLPDWLQAVAARETDQRPPASLPPDPPGPSHMAPVEVAGRHEPVAVPAIYRGWPAPPVAGIQAATERPHHSDQEHVRLTPSPAPVARPWWMSDVAVAVLFVAIVLTLIYVVLTASGVV